MTARAPLAALLLAAALPAPFRTEEPRVRDGNAALAGGRPDEALRLYAEAERAAGAHPEIDLDRGDAAFARGDLAGAADGWRRAAAHGAPALASRALQNLGTALAAAGDRDGAARALADALARDPANEDARWNLEVLLRQRAAGGTPPRDRAEALASARGAADVVERGADASAEPRVRPAASVGEPRAEIAEAPAAPPAREPLSREHAEALLDALRARERTAPFSPRGARDERRPDAAKDW